MIKFDCLIVDDEEALSQSTCEYFNMFGLKTYWVKDEKSCFQFLNENKTDIILLDINLGNSSGFEICKKLKKSFEIPILFISGRTSDDDVLLALNIGGDDYIQKPYSLSVLLAKVKLALKKSRPQFHSLIRFGDFTIDLVLKKLLRGDLEIKLKAMEYKLLTYLAINKDRTISKDELFRKVWNDAITGDGTLNVHVRRLREKIEDDPNNPQYIKTIWKTGYVFEI
jgi:two-component system response regulator RegX3